MTDPTENFTDNSTILEDISTDSDSGSDSDSDEVDNRKSTMNGHSVNSDVKFKEFDANFKNIFINWIQSVINYSTATASTDMTKKAKLLDIVMKIEGKLIAEYISNNMENSSINYKIGGKQLIKDIYGSRKQYNILAFKHRSIVNEVDQSRSVVDAKNLQIKKLALDAADAKILRELHMRIINQSLDASQAKDAKLLVYELIETRTKRMESRTKYLYDSLKIRIAQRSLAVQKSSSSRRSSRASGSNISLEDVNQVVVDFAEESAGSGGMGEIPKTSKQKCMFGPLTTHFRSNRTSSTNRDANEMKFARYAVGSNAQKMIFGMGIQLDNFDIIGNHAIMRVNIDRKMATGLDVKQLRGEDKRVDKERGHESLLDTSNIPGYDGAMLITPIDEGQKAIGLFVMLHGYYDKEEPECWQRALNKIYQEALGSEVIKTDIEGSARALRKFIPPEIAQVVISNAGFDFSRSYLEQLKNIQTEIYHPKATALVIDITNCTSLANAIESIFMKRKVIDPFINKVHNLLKKPPFANNLMFIKSNGDGVIIGQVNSNLDHHAELCLLFIIKFMDNELPLLNEMLKTSGVTMDIHSGLSFGPAWTTFEYKHDRLELDFNGPPINMASKLETAIGTTSHIDKLRGKCNVAMSELFIDQLANRGLLKNMIFSWNEHNVENIKIIPYGKCEILGHGKPPVEVFGFTRE